MTLPSLVLDLVALAVIVMCAAYYARRGFIAGVFSFFGTLIAIILAALAAYNLSPAIFNTFFRPGLEKQMVDTIAEQGIFDVEHLMENIAGFLPLNIQQTLLESLDIQLDFAAPDIAAHVVDQVVAPLVTPFITVILFFLLFSLVRILLGVVRSMAVGLAKMPAINTVNSALGAVAGVFIALLYIYIALCAIWAYDSLNPAAAVGTTYFAKSLVFRLLSPLNFFTML